MVYMETTETPNTRFVAGDFVAYSWGYRGEPSVRMDHGIGSRVIGCEDGKRATHPMFGR